MKRLRLSTSVHTKDTKSTKTINRKGHKGHKVGTRRFPPEADQPRLTSRAQTEETDYVRQRGVKKYA